MAKLQCSITLFGVLFLCFGCTTVHADGSRQEAEIVLPEDAKALYEAWGFAPAVKIDNVIYVSGVVSVLEGEGSYAEQYALGFKSTLQRIDFILKEAGASLDDVIDITTFLTDLQRQLEIAIGVRMKEMKAPHPAWAAIGIIRGQTTV